MKFRSQTTSKPQIATYAKVKEDLVHFVQCSYKNGTDIAKYLKVPESVIGLTIIAIGTSLPEIATCIVAARKGHGDLAFGEKLQQ